MRGLDTAMTMNSSGVASALLARIFLADAAKGFSEGSPSRCIPGLRLKADNVLLFV